MADPVVTPEPPTPAVADVLADRPVEPPSRKPLDHLAGPVPARPAQRQLSTAETDEIRWANTFSIGTFRLVLMPVLILVLLVFLILWSIFGM